MGAAQTTNNAFQILFDNVGGAGSASNEMLLGIAGGTLVSIGSTGALGALGGLNGPLGNVTAYAAAVTTLTASGAVSGTGFSTYLASPPAIGGTAAAAGTFTALAATTLLRLPATVYASLEPSPDVGDQLVITDASACTFGTQISAGGGTIHSCPAVYNGAGWYPLVTH